MITDMPRLSFDGPRWTEGDWTPRKHGNVYCSPACGSGCTKVAYDLAHAEGKKLAKALGKDWTHRVWENMGWHFEAISPCQRLNVSKSYGNGYTAYLNETGRAGGIWYASGNTPKQAVANVIAEGREQAAFYQSLVEGL